MKKLEETQWSRIYVDPQGMRVYESRLEVEGASVSLPFVEQQWTKWTQPQRFDFARALSRKTKLSKEDESVLQYLLRTDDDVIASTVANAISRFSDHGTARNLLLHRMVTCMEPRANFYQALANFKDEQVVAALSNEYVHLKQEIERKQDQLDLTLDYIACCATLARLTANHRYSATVRQYTANANETIRNFARSLLQSE